jgi:hypothetical protein
MMSENEWEAKKEEIPLSPIVLCAGGCVGGELLGNFDIVFGEIKNGGITAGQEGLLALLWCLGLRNNS